MRICLVSKEYPPETAHGGIGTQTWNKARALVTLGHDVLVVSSQTGNATAPAEVVDDVGVTVTRIPTPSAETTVYSQAVYDAAYSWNVLRHLGPRLERGELDVVDVAEYGAEGFAYQLNRTPWNWAAVVVQLHGPLAMFSERIGWPERDSDFARVVTFMEDLSIRRADALMACSANIADFTSGYHQVPRQEIDVVHCGVDAELFRPRRRDSSAPPRVLFVGNLAPNKGLETAFRAVRSLRDRYPKLRLRVLGRGDEALLDHLRRQDPDAIEYAGFVQDRADVAAEYAQADVFCSPALHEVGVANVYLEAMACGCPVVAASTGGAPEAVTDGVEGFLVPPGTPDAAARAIDRLLADARLRSEMAANARRRVDDYFALGPYLDRVLAVYERALASSERQRAEQKVALGVT